jgi:hypothetical protein
MPRLLLEAFMFFCASTSVWLPFIIKVWVEGCFR